MSGERGQAPSSLRIARRVLDRTAAPAADDVPAAAAMQRALTRVSDNLRASMGKEGCGALLARALSRAEAKHPALKDVCRLTGGEVHLDGVAAAIDVHGTAAVAAAIEALLAALLEVLIRLIGEDMAIRVIDYEAPGSRIGGGAQAP
jgi:hypothetical protein